MASRRGTANETVYIRENVIHGHHIYMYKAVWTPVLGEVYRLEIGEDNEHDCFAVCVKRSDEIIGHVPRKLSSKVWHFKDMEGEQHVKLLAEESEEMDWRCRVSIASSEGDG